MTFIFRSVSQNGRRFCLDKRRDFSTTVDRVPQCSENSRCSHSCIDKAETTFCCAKFNSLNVLKLVLLRVLSCICDIYRALFRLTRVTPAFLENSPHLKTQLSRVGMWCLHYLLQIITQYSESLTIVFLPSCPCFICIQEIMQKSSNNRNLEKRQLFSRRKNKKKFGT